jgi:tryptophan synthase alpha chain
MRPPKQFVVELAEYRQAAHSNHLAMNRIEQTFKKLKASGRKGFIAYITGGDPSLDATVALVKALEEAGADIIELGVPFSDPLADGIVNQMAAQRALRAGATVAKLLETIRHIRERSEIPLVLFTYLNPVYRYGYDHFHGAAAAAGADGVLILDLPFEEQQANRELSQSHALCTIRLVAPTTPPERIARITASGSGFIYYVSREGVTGEQQNLSSSIAEQVLEIKKTTTLPVAVGFGISTPEQAGAVARAADAVVVGSAIVRRIGEAGDSPKLAEMLRDFVQPLGQAVHSI